MPKPWNPLGLPGCAYCIHNRDDGTCAASPDGIPLPIGGGDIAHTRPLPGDHGIQFEGVRDPAVPASLYAAVDE
jgi:hypothetical protein